jgi:MFS family permease
VIPHSPLAVRDFRVYFFGQFVSLVGMWMQMLAQGWVITRMTGSTAVMGQIAFIQSIPMGLFSMRAGLLADRHDRRKILIVTQVLLAILAAALGAMIYWGKLTLPAIYVYAVLVGVVAAFDFPAQQALVPQLVPPALIPKAVGLNQVIFHGSRLVGPALAGILLAITSEAAVFFANALSYLAVIYSLVIIPSRPIAARAPAGLTPPGAPARGGIGEGLSYVRGERTVFTMIATTGLITVFLMPIFAVFMPMVGTRLFHTSEAELGMVMGASGLGSLLGALAMMRVPPVTRGRFLLWSVTVAGAATAFLSQVHSPYAAAAVIFVLNLHSSLTLGLSATIIQQIVPDRLRGRVMGLYGMTFAALMPPFSLLWGHVADWTSLRVLVLGLGGAYGVFGLSLLLGSGVLGRLRADGGGVAVTTPR